MSALHASGPSFGLLVACTVKSTGLLGLTWLLASAARHRSAAFRHWIWLLGIIGSLVLPFLTLLLPAWHSAMLLDTSSFVARGDSRVHSTTIDVIATSPLFDNSGRVMVWLWAAGFAVVSLRLATGLARLAWASARSQLSLDENWLRTISEFSIRFEVRRRVRLLQYGGRTAVPLTWGVFRPVILLPAAAREWPEARRQMVIGHELAHVARNDWILQILAELARGLYWFHPLSWKAARSLREQSECACDDFALKCGIEPARYASELLDFARTLQRSGQTWAAALGFSRSSNFERRLTSMLDPLRNRNQLSLKMRLLVVFPALCLVLPLAAMHLPAQNASGTFSGVVYDPSGATVPDATVTMTNGDSKRIEITRSGGEGSFKFAALAPGQYELKVAKLGFREYKASPITIMSDHSAAPNPEVVRVTLKLEGQGKAAEEKSTPTHVPGEIMGPRLINKVEPEYPAAAKAAGVEGTVLLNAVIGKKGNLLELRVMNSEVDPELARAALKAVSQWQYSPVLLNGEPVEIETTVTVNFKLGSKAGL
jgi:TonB family protein